MVSLHSPNRDPVWEIYTDLHSGVNFYRNAITNEEEWDDRALQVEFRVYKKDENNQNIEVGQYNDFLYNGNIKTQIIKHSETNNNINSETNITDAAYIEKIVFICDKCEGKIIE